MNETAALLADCPDSVTVTFNGVTTPALYILRTAAEDGLGDQLSVNFQREHLVIAEGELTGLKKKSAITFTRNGVTLARTVRDIRPKDDDPALLYVSMEKA